MKKLHGLPAQLDSYLHRHGGWVPKGTLTADMVWTHTNGKHKGARYLPETVGRALRNLEEQRFVAVKDDGISVAYKYLPPEMRANYIPSSMRTGDNKGRLFRDRQEMEAEVRQ